MRTHRLWFLWPVLLPGFVALGQFTDAAVASVTCTPETFAAETSDSLWFGCVPRNRAGAPMTNNITAWWSRNTAVATVTKTGGQTARIVAKAKGDTWVGGSYKGKRDSSRITVVPISAGDSACVPATLTLTPDSVRYTAIGDNSIVRAAVVNACAQTDTLVPVTFIVRASSIAGLAVTGPQTVRLTAVSNGTTYLVATISNLLIDSAKVTVAATVPDTTPADTGATACAPGATVCAGPDKVGTVGSPITLTGTAPSGQFIFWSKISGPGEAVFGHEMFNASFEDGTVNEWIGDGGASTVGDGYTTEEQAAHSGDWTWKAYNDATGLPEAKLLRWRFDLVTGYYSAWYYWPASVPNISYNNIFQFKAGTSPFDPNWIVTQRGANFGIHDYRLATNITLPAGIPKNRWFQLTMYNKIHPTAGRLILWLDDKVIWDASNLNTQANQTVNNDMMWGVGFYSTEGQNKWHYVDDTWVSSAAAYPNPSSTTVTLSAAGNYVLRLHSYDGTTTRTDDVTVTVP